MEACQNLLKDMDKLDKNYNFFSGQTQLNLLSLMATLSQFQRTIECSPQLIEANYQEYTKFQSQMKEAMNTISSEHRIIHPTVSKFGKTIDKSFEHELSGLLVPGFFQGYRRINKFDRAVHLYLLRHGYTISLDNFCLEANFSSEDDQRVLYLLIDQISNSILEKDILPALDWCECNHECLLAMNSTLELKLFELQFLQLLMSKGVNDAIQFSHTMYHKVIHFTNYVQRIIGSLTYANSSFKYSPYASLCNDNQWKNVSELFKREAFKLKKLPVECSLSTALKAGCHTLPSLAKMKIVIQRQEKYDVLTKYDELPIDIDLKPNLRFHSIFACPILRQQAVDISSQPVRLTCGHLIGYESMRKMCSNHGHFKCPYCPIQMHESEVIHIILYK